MQLSFDGAPEAGLTGCHECNSQHEVSTGFVLRDGVTYAVYWASWYPHANEIYVDCIIGSWIEPDYADHVTFGCRIGAGPGSTRPQCTLTHGGATKAHSALFGQKLERQDALGHPRLQDFWDCIDWLVVNDPLLCEHGLFDTP